MDVNFNPFIVYETFERQLQFQSLRTFLKIAEEQWLAACSTTPDSEIPTELRSEDDPSYYPISERGQLIANQAGEYMIGSTIYRVESDGLVYEIQNSDFNALDAIRNGSNFEIVQNNYANVIVHREEVRNATEAADCKAFIRHTKDNEYDPNDNKKKMFCILDLDWDGWNSVAKAKAECYKYRKNWRGKWEWKRHWTDMGCWIQVMARDMNCAVKSYVGENGYLVNNQYRSWAYYVSVHVYGEVLLGMRIKPGEYGGNFKKNGYDDYYIAW